MVPEAKRNGDRERWTQQPATIDYQAMIVDYHEAFKRNMDKDSDKKQAKKDKNSFRKRSLGIIFTVFIAALSAKTKDLLDFLGDRCIKKIYSYRKRSLGIIFTIFIAVLSAKTTGLLDFLGDQFTERIYSYEFLSIKNYEGKLFPQDKQLGYYFFVKIKFSKPWYASSVKICPEVLRIVETNNINKLVDEYHIVHDINPKQIFIPKVDTFPNNNIVGVDYYNKYNGHRIAFSVNPYQVGEKMGISKAMETFYDINNRMVSLPLILRRNEEAIRIFIFKLKGNKPHQPAFGNPNLSYQLVGANVNTKPFQFIFYFQCHVFEDSNTPQYVFIYDMKEYIRKKAYKKGYHKLTHTKYRNVDVPILKIFKGILEIYLDNSAVGNEIIKNNLPFLSNNEIIEIMPEIIWANISKKNPEFVESYLNGALNIAPNYILFHDIKAQYFMEIDKWNEALKIYEELTPILTMDTEQYYPLLITKGLLLFTIGFDKVNDRKLANYYLLENIGKLDPKRDKKLINCIYFVIGTNFFYEEKIEKAKAFFEKIDPNSYYDNIAKRLLKNNKLKEGIIEFVYR